MTDQETKEMLESTLGPEIDALAQEVFDEGENIQEPQPESTLEVNNPIQWYEFDFEKVQTIDDIKLILSSMGMKFNEQVPNFDTLKEISKKID